MIKLIIKKIARLVLPENIEEIKKHFQTLKVPIGIKLNPIEAYLTGHIFMEFIIEGEEKEIKKLIIKIHEILYPWTRKSP